MTKRVRAILVVSACGVLCAGALAVGARWRHMTAHRVPLVTVKTNAGERLASFFQDLRPDPRYTLKKLMEAETQRKSIAQCRSQAKPGLWGRFSNWLERTVYAQGTGPNCGQTACQGGGFSSGFTSCVQPNCSGVYSNPTPFTGPPNSGTRLNGTVGCNGGSSACECNIALCTQGGVGAGGYCNVDSDCQTGTYCNNHQCTNVCTQDSDCPSDQYCSGSGLDARCVAPACFSPLPTCPRFVCTGSNQVCNSVSRCCECSGFSCLGAEDGTFCSNGGICQGGCCGEAGGGTGGGGGCTDGACNYDRDCCSGNCQSDGECGSEDPIVIDLSGSGYQMTSAAQGVKFDFFGNGKPLLISWTAAGWNGGFLALDRNGNGKIDNGTELFGNVTPQPKPTSGTGNGFLALAQYDQPANGGNNDGQIDVRDAIYSKLVVWVDRNHNGVSDPGELLTLKQAGILSISLKYAKSPWTDLNGNKFRYKSRMTRAAASPGPPEWIYDVLLLAK
jgi:hypothetical protein